MRHTPHHPRMRGHGQYRPGRSPVKTEGKMKNIQIGIIGGTGGDWQVVCQVL